MKKLILVAAVAVSWAFADHNSPVGSVARLVTETFELQQIVQQSTLMYQVKRAVFDFSNQVSRLADCVRYNGRPVIHDHLEDPGCPVYCGNELQATRSRFYTVERYLYDTSWDYPQAYQAYLGVRQALNTIVVTGHPGPGPTPHPTPNLVSCVAVDNGWEEHSGGHAAYGRNVYEAQRAALRACQRFHGSCRIRSCQ